MWCQRESPNHYKFSLALDIYNKFNVHMSSNCQDIFLLSKYLMDRLAEKHWDLCHKREIFFFAYVNMSKLHLLSQKCYVTNDDDNAKAH